MVQRRGRRLLLIRGQITPGVLPRSTSTCLTNYRRLLLHLQSIIYCKPRSSLILTILGLQSHSTPTRWHRNPKHRLLRRHFHLLNINWLPLLIQCWFLGLHNILGIEGLRESVREHLDLFDGMLPWNCLLVVIDTPLIWNLISIDVIIETCRWLSCLPLLQRSVKRGDCIKPRWSLILFHLLLASRFLTTGCDAILTSDDHLKRHKFFFSLQFLIIMIPCFHIHWVVHLNLNILLAIDYLLLLKFVIIRTIARVIRWKGLQSLYFLVSCPVIGWLV